MNDAPDCLHCGVCCFSDLETYVRVTGEDCFYMKVHVASVEHLEEVIDRFTPYGQTTTSIIQSSPVAQRELKPA